METTFPHRAEPKPQSLAINNLNCPNSVSFIEYKQFYVSLLHTILYCIYLENCIDFLLCLACYMQKKKENKISSEMTCNYDYATEGSVNALSC